jgi:ribosome-interacting GTPase 1
LDLNQVCDVNTRLLAARVSFHLTLYVLVLILILIFTEKVVYQILKEYKISSADVLAREDITVDQLVDAVEGNRVYCPALYLYNKIDTVTIEEIDQLARMPHSIVGSVSFNYNISGPMEDDMLKQKMWEYLGLTRCYTKRKGSAPDVGEPVVLSRIRRGTLVRSLCANISTELLRDFNYALVWGTSAKHMPQRCGLDHPLDDQDVVQIVTKTVKQQSQDKNYNALSQVAADKHAKKRLEAKKQKQSRLRG